MQINRYDDQAVLIMLELAQNYGIRNISLSEIAAKHGLSPLILKKIIRPMVKSHLVTSKEGINGGYMLSRVPDQITLWDILSKYNLEQKDISGNIPSRCPIRKICLPQRVSLGINIALKNGLSELTLAQLNRKGI